MGKILIIAEKPSVARDIAAALKGFSKTDDWLESPTAIVSSGIGHLVGIDVVAAATTGFDLASLPIIPNKFDLRPIDKTKSQLMMLKKLMQRKDVDTIVNACDAGREGELIFRLIYEWVGCTKPMKRMWLQSMTATAIVDAFNKMKPGSDYDNLSDAAKCRSEADWLIGINGSRGVTRLYERLNGRSEMMNAGRVQTPTLAILVHREQAIRNFVPQEFWEVHGSFKSENGTYIGKWLNPKAVEQKEKSGEEGSEEAQTAGNRINDKAQAEVIVKKCKGVNPSSVKDQKKIGLNPAPKLFDLTTLQREANKKFKFSAKKTLDLAQSLYEKHKATSYPRTDASALPEDYVPKAGQVMQAMKARSDFAPHADRVLVNAWIKPDKRIFDDSKISDHFAIIPTGMNPVSLTADEEKLYEMIVLRFIAAFHPPAEYSNTTRITIVADESFKTTGKVLMKQGWQEVYGKQAANSKTPSLCVVKDGEQVLNKGMALKTFSTKPPTRFTEAALLSAMEGAGKLIDDDELRDAMKERGLGTPATRAATIEGLLSKMTAKKKPKTPYVEREGKEQFLVPTFKGEDLVEFLDANGIQSLTSPRMTGEWESKLREMEKGAYKRADFMDEIGTMTRSIIDIIRSRSAEAGPEVAIDLGTPTSKCPKCGAALTASHRTVDCSSACGFKLWRVVAGRTLSIEEVDQLLTDGITATLSGFTSRARRKFSAALKLNAEYNVDFVFEPRAEAPGSREPVGKPLKVACPLCKGAVSLMGGGNPQYVCAAGDFKIWQKIAGRLLSDEEVTELIKGAALPKLTGFYSTKKKRSFDAGLKLSRDKSQVEFVFEPR